MSQYDEQTTPAVCASCLGPNPYIEMIRERNGLECKLCTRPFTVFKWAPVKGATGSSAFKKTVICLTCSRSKNCCQVCMLDLNFGIDMNTRDELLKLSGDKKAVLGGGSSEPQNVVMKMYKAEQLERKYRTEGEDGIEDEDEKKEKVKSLLEGISQLVENKQQRAQEKQSKSKGGDRNGKKDSKDDVKISNAELLKLCKNLPFNGTLSTPPKNPKVKSFFIFGTNDQLSDYLIKEKLNELLGESRSSNKKVETLWVNHRGRFAFVEFSSRSIAEQLAEIILKQQQQRSSTNQTYQWPCLLVINKTPVRVCWAGKYMFNGGDSGGEMAKIRLIVKKQLIKYAEKDSGPKKDKRFLENDDGNKSVKKPKTKSLPPPPLKNIQYKSMKADYEL